MKRLLITFSVTIAIVATTAVVALIPGASAQTPAIVIKKRSSASAFVSDRKIIRFLVIGNDVRKDASVEGQRADAIHVVSLNTETGKGSVINIPRDSYVNIAPKRGKARINAALEFGGMEAQVATVEELVGFEIDYWAMTDFDGLIALVNAIGGVTVDVPEAMNDKGSGAVFSKGPTQMNGDQALAFSRNRHFETGDFQRTEHQAILMLAILKKLREESQNRPNVIKYMDILRRNIETEMSSAEIFELMSFGLQVPPENIVNYTMKGGTSTIDGASVVILTGNDSELEKIKKTGVPT